MASDERRRVDAKIAEQNLHNSQMAKDTAAETDQFKCNRCQQRRCKYYQMQTRSADEPMTTFVTCVNCGNRWRVSRAHRGVDRVFMMFVCGQFRVVLLASMTGGENENENEKEKEKERERVVQTVQTAQTTQTILTIQTNARNKGIKWLVRFPCHHNRHTTDMGMEDAVKRPPMSQFPSLDSVPGLQCLRRLSTTQLEALKFAMSSAFLGTTSGLLFGGVTTLKWGLEGTSAGRANLLRATKIFSISPA